MSDPISSHTPPTTLELEEIALYLAEIRALVLEEIDRLLPAQGEASEELYELVRLYPMREAKALRPALCVAACRALNGAMEAVLPTAAALELYHNAFLIHDDVEDRSLQRRGAPTLHQTHGMPVAMNVGDAMLALTLRPLLDNTATIGLGRALRVLQAIQHMAMETAEGQALELDWIRRGRWDLSEDDYLRMVRKKTTWYSFITPVSVGALIAGGSRATRAALARYAADLGAAFQIQDDVLNLTGREERVGKEASGDLWEGKRTLILLHTLRHATPSEREEAVRILARPRPEEPGAARVAIRDARARIAALRDTGALTPADAEAILSALPAPPPERADRVKSPEDVAFLRGLIDRYGGIERARIVAAAAADRASAALDEAQRGMGDSIHTALLGGLIRFVVDRDR